MTGRAGGRTDSGPVPLPEDLSGVVNCRRWLHRRLDALGLPTPARADVELVAGELIANAFLHASAPRSVWLRVFTGARASVRVTVRDASSHRPLPRSAAATETHGRGLRVVAALAERWGTQSRVDGKAVWADLPIPTRRARVFTGTGAGKPPDVSGTL